MSVTDHVDLAIEGMTCASCAARIERTLNGLPGVAASVNYVTERASVDYEPGAVAPTDLVAAVEDLGYRAAPGAAGAATPATTPAAPAAAALPDRVEGLSIGGLRRPGTATADAPADVPAEVVPPAAEPADPPALVALRQRLV